MRGTDLPPVVRTRVRAWAITAAGVAVVAAALAWVVPAHPVGEGSASGWSETCAVRTDDASEQHAVVGVLAPRTSRAARITVVRLVEPVNIELADAMVLPVVAVPGADTVTFGASTGWPLTPELQAELTLDWAAERPAVGASLDPDVEKAIGLHVQVDDPALDAAYAGVQVEYRMLGARWVQTYPQAFVMPGGLATCRTDDVLS